MSQHFLLMCFQKKNSNNFINSKKIIQTQAPQEVMLSKFFPFNILNWFPLQLLLYTGRAGTSLILSRFLFNISLNNGQQLSVNFQIGNFRKKVTAYLYRVLHFGQAEASWSLNLVHYSDLSASAIFPPHSVYPFLHLCVPLHPGPSLLYVLFLIH